MTDNTEDLVINTTHRYGHFCPKKRKIDNAKCSLYSPHEGDHKTKHLAESFTDEEAN
jgi:hypothetical protein